MRETDFIRQNKEKWLELEELLKDERKDPDKLSRLFVQVTDDLSYARTFYPNRSVRLFLNALAQQVFHSIYKNKKEGWKKFTFFWKEELPRLVWEARKDLLLSLAVFIVAALIGAVSTANDAHFPRVILGDSYVDQTLENIRKGDPMAIYKSSGGVDMFLGITVNNIQVAFMTFVFGAFLVAGTFAMLVYNGIMLGSFQYFFYQHGLLLPSFLTIWLHGTLEISSIILAAGAGITMGKGLLFPGTYSRMQSFLLSARRGFKILAGIVPILVLAAIIESFMTRYTEMPAVLRGGLILASLIFILGYFAWYPFVKSRRGFAPATRTPRLPASPEAMIETDVIKTNGELFRDVFTFYRKEFWKLLRAALIVGAAATALTLVVQRLSGALHIGYRQWFYAMQLFDFERWPWMWPVQTVFFTVCTWYSLLRLEKSIPGAGRPDRGSRVASFLKLFLFVLLFGGLFLLPPVIAVLAAVPAASLFVLWMHSAVVRGRSIPGAITEGFSAWNVMPGKAMALAFMLGLLATIFFFMLDSPLVFLFYEIINWNLSLDQHTVQAVVLGLVVFVSYTGIYLVFPLILSGCSLQYYTLFEIREAKWLNRKIDSLQAKPNVL